MRVEVAFRSEEPTEAIVLSNKEAVLGTEDVRIEIAALAMLPATNGLSASRRRKRTDFYRPSLTGTPRLSAL
jgi:hypothetical protein